MTALTARAEPELVRRVSCCERPPSTAAAMLAEGADRALMTVVNVLGVGACARGGAAAVVHACRSYDNPGAGIPLCDVCKNIEAPRCC